MKEILSRLGFEEISIQRKDRSEEIVRGWQVVDGAENYVFSAYIQAVKG